MSKVIFSIDQEAFNALLKEAFKKAISEMPADFIKCEVVAEKNEPQRYGAHPVVD